MAALCVPVFHLKDRHQSFLTFVLELDLDCCTMNPLLFFHPFAFCPEQDNSKWFRGYAYWHLNSVLGVPCQIAVFGLLLACLLGFSILR